MIAKRNRLDVIHDILAAVRDSNNSIRPTPLLRQSNLSSQNFSRYLGELLEKGFLREMPDSRGRKHYTLTDRGFRYLEQYRNILTFIDDFNL